MKKIDWSAFTRRYVASSEANRISLIATHLKRFDTQPDWVSDEIWGAALREYSK